MHACHAHECRNLHMYAPARTHTYTLRVLLARLVAEAGQEVIMVLKNTAVASTVLPNLS